VVRTATTINGRLVSRRLAKISIFDNSLLYAEGLFETFLAVGEQAIFAEEHFDRLQRGAKTIGLDLPVSIDRLQTWVKRTLRAHRSPLKKLRLTVTSGESARWLGRSGRPQVILSAAPHQLPTKPFRLYVSDFKIDHRSIFRPVKTLSYAINAAALKQALEANCDDALLLNQLGNVAEVTSANVFWIDGDFVFTPPLTAGCLEGVTRRIVLREAKQLGIRIKEKRCPLSCLLEADEVFISSSLKLVVGVGMIHYDRKRHRLPTGPVTSTLQDHFRRLAGVA